MKDLIINAQYSRRTKTRVSSYDASITSVSADMSGVPVDWNDESKGKKPMITLKFKTDDNKNHSICIYGEDDILGFISMLDKSLRKLYEKESD